MTEQRETDELHAKVVGVLEIKDADKGDVEAIVATLDVVDKDQEVVRSGAITSGAKVKLSEWGHNSVGMFGVPRMPVGKGVIVIEANKAVFRGRFFLSTSRGAEAFRVIKEMGADQQWSFGYRITGTEVPNEEWRKKGAVRILTKLEPFEVSPVAIGAGVGTRTVEVKEGEDAAAEAAAAEAARAEAAKRQADDARQASEALAADAAVKQAAAQEFERFERTRRRLGGS